jgi:L-fuconolactonase
MPVIDSHHHFWHYNPVQHAWIPRDWTALQRDFLPADLASEIANACVDGVISVHARQSLEETRWLLELASKHAFIRGVVGWVPLIDPAVDAILESLVANPKLRGVRHVLHDEVDDRYMLRADFNRGIEAVTRRGLVYDILIFERHLRDTLTFVDGHPNQVFVVDHIAKPRIAAGELEPWVKNLRELARRPNVFCKVSGMVTEADVTTWTPDQLKPYFDTVLDIFGPRRLLYGTDWPACLAGVTYARWKEIVEEWIAPLSASERAAMMGENAVRVYRLA